MKTLLKWIGGVFVALLIVLGGGIYALSTDKVQQWLYAKGVAMLQETLGTRVKVDKIAISFSKGGVALYGLEIDDRKNITMLKVDTLEAMVDLTRIFDRQVEIERVYLHGASGVFYKEHKDTAANYQFALDVIKSLSHKEDKDKEEEKKKDKTPLSLDLKLLSLQRTYVQWDVKSLPHKVNKFDGKPKLDGNHMRLRVDNVQIRGKLDDNLPQKFSVLKLKAKEENSNTVAAFESLNLAMKGDTCMEVTLEKLHGEFIYWNFDIKGSDAITIHLAKKDGKTVFDMTRPMEIGLNDINATRGNGTKATIPHLTGTLTIVDTKTDSGTIKKKPVITLSKTPISARVVLKDLAIYKARALRNFTTPLNLTASVDGELDKLNLRNIHVTTDDKRLNLTAEGKMLDITKKKQFKFHIRNVNLSARNGIKEQLVNHFSKQVNLKMQSQMRMLGDVHYRGYLNIYRWNQDFHGVLITKFGNIRFDFNLNGKTRYMSGTASVKDFEVGKVMEVKQIGTTSFSAKYNFDIASKKWAKKLGRVKGKLPRGTFSGIITDTKMLNDKVTIHQVKIALESDGFTANGSTLWVKKLFNVGVDFIYHQTDNDQYYNYKTYITKDDNLVVRKWTQKDIEQARAYAAKYAEKEAAKKAKQEEKAQRKADKQAAKEARQAEKAKQKAEKQAAKEAAANDTTKTKKKKKFLFF